MPALDCPFRKADALLGSIPGDVKIRIVDFHGEATSEKQALGWYLDGQVTAVLGTHTHVPTADETVLPQGTAYLTDLGMTGPYESIIGMERQGVIQKFLDQLPARFEVAKGDVRLSAALLDVDPQSGHALSIARVLRKYPQSLR
jgi:metallophosphoesterase (TIGR00282 family)